MGLFRARFCSARELHASLPIPSSHPAHAAPCRVLAVSLLADSRGLRGGTLLYCVVYADQAPLCTFLTLVARDRLSVLDLCAVKCVMALISACSDHACFESFQHAQVMHASKALLMVVSLLVIAALG
jgi:hypothetical protein